MEAVLEGERVGVALRNFSESSMAEAADRMLALSSEPGARARCTAVANRLFSLKQGVADYRAIYRTLVA